MKDRNGEILKVGDKFYFHVGKPHECIGKIFNCGGVEVIKWLDDDSIISVADFYHEPTHQYLLQKV